MAHNPQPVQELEPRRDGPALAPRQASWTILVVRLIGGLVFFGQAGIFLSAVGLLKWPEYVLPFLVGVPSVVFALFIPEQRTAIGPQKAASPRSCLGWATSVIELLFSGLLRLCGGGGATVALTLILWNILMPAASPKARIPTSGDFWQFFLEAGVVLCGGAFAGLLTLVLPLNRALWLGKKGKLKVDSGE